LTPRCILHQQIGCSLEIRICTHEM